MGLEKSEMNLTEVLIDDLYNRSQSDIPPEVLKEAKNCLLDYLGVTFAGARMTEAKTRNLLSEIEVSSALVTIIGIDQRASLFLAALINGMHSHVAELDDGERFGMFHPGAPIISALLPIAEQKRLSGQDLLKGIVIGYEAAIRLARALQPGMKDRGYHATGICGTIGAAIAIGTSLCFSKQELKNAFSAAATSASGILKVIRDVSELKPYNVGQAAQNGISAAMMSLAGFQGPVDVLGGELGFLSIMADKVNLDRLIHREDNQFGIRHVYRKPYAACRHCHAPIEASLLLKAQFRLEVEDIKSIKVRTYFWAVGGHEHTQIEGVNSAKMSIPYSVAVALATGAAGLNEFSEACIADQTIDALTKKVTVEVDDTMTQLVPQKRAAVVEITTMEGQQFSKRIDLPKGEPETPLSNEELVNKFSSLAQYSGRGEADINQIIDAVWNVETDSTRLYKLLGI